jgi:hypothetical protein
MSLLMEGALSPGNCMAHDGRDTWILLKKSCVLIREVATERSELRGDDPQAGAPGSFAAGGGAEPQ